MLICVASNEPAFQGIEKAMFYRICRLLTLNIQLVFVFDGPGVPAKRGRNGGRKIDYERLRLLKQMLQCFGIPYQEAPGEAEAECARLQMLGIVDAVWSQDSDCLMFGCSLWIHDDRVAKEKGDKDRSKENTKKSGKTVRVVRAKEMKDKLNLDREGLVLFAMLVGGDYYTTGLPGCGAGIALRVIKEGTLAQALCMSRNQKDCAEWRFRLAAFLQTMPRARGLVIPANFPDYKILQKYYRPKVTSDELLIGKKALNLANARSIDELKLLDVTSSRFNIWGRLYLNWVGPVLLLRSLSNRSTSLGKGVLHDIKLTKQRASKSEEVMSLRSFERKITFSPFEVTDLRREDFEGGDREGFWDGKRGVPFDPTHRVECDYFPLFWLQRVLPSEVLDPPLPEPKQNPSKRKRQNISDESASSSSVKKPQRSQNHSVAGTAARLDKSDSNNKSCTTAVGTPSTRAQKPKSTGKRTAVTTRPTLPESCLPKPSATGPLKVIDLSTLEDDLVLHVPSKQKSKRLSSLQASLSHVVDLGSPGSSADESDDVARAIQLSIQSSDQERGASNESAASRKLSVSRLPSNVQDLSGPLHSTMLATKAISCGKDAERPAASSSHVVSSSELNQIRAARLRHFTSTSLSDIEPDPLGKSVSADYIDLTGD